MGLGALEARWERAFNEPKIIQIGLLILAGDDFEKYFLARNFENAPVHVQHDIVLKTIEITQLSLVFQWNASILE